MDFEKALKAVADRKKIERCIRCDAVLSGETICPVCGVKSGTDGSVSEHYRH